MEWTKAVLKWGGILGNNEETILKYATQSAESLCSLSEGVASWSKVLAFRYPDKYFIYDYRVAFVLITFWSVMLKKSANISLFRHLNV